MLSVNHQEFKLKKAITKQIRGLAPAFNDTLCVLRQHELISTNSCLSHINKEGKILKNICRTSRVYSMAMLTDKQCCLLQTQNNQIFVWNLDTLEQFCIKHQFNSNIDHRSNIDMFPDTFLVAIREHGCQNNKTFKLTYYQFPLTQQSKACHIFEDNQNVWTHHHSVRRANNHSMYIIYNFTNKQYFQFKTYDLKGGNGTLQSYKYPQDVGKLDGKQYIRVWMRSIWQMQNKQFLMVCFTDSPKQGNKNYICNTETNLISKANFQFGGKNNKLVAQDNLGGFCRFRMLSQDQQKMFEPIYYISNITQETIYQEKEYNASTTHCFIGTEGNMIVDYFYDNYNVRKIDIKIKKIIELKEVTVHFLHQIIEDPDSDLLYDVTKIIDYRK